MIFEYFNLIQVAYAQDATTTAEIVNTINDNYINNLNSSWYLILWIAGIAVFIWLVGILGGGFISFVKSIFGLKGRRK